MAVSIVVPSHNSRSTLGKLLVSLLNQDLPKNMFEIILIDDASTDGSIESVQDIIENAKGYNIKTLRNQRKTGPAGTRNVGIQFAKEIVAFIDADCTADPSWLRRLIEGFTDNSIGVVYGRVLASDDSLLIPTIRTAPITAGSVRCTTCNIAYRKDVLLDIGLFDEEFKKAWREDSDLALRALEKGWQIAYAQDAVVYHIIKTLSLSQLIRNTMMCEYDNLLYRKHPNIRDYSYVLGDPFAKLPGPLWGPLSALGLLTISGLVFLTLFIILFGLVFTILSITTLFLFYLIIFTLFGYDVIFKSKNKMPKHLKFRVAVRLAFLLSTAVIARCYGSIKFRKFFL